MRTSKACSPRNVVRLALVALAISAPPSSAQVCVPHVTAPAVINGTDAGDWGVFTSKTFELAAVGGAADPNYRVRVVTTTDSLYFFAEVAAPLSSPESFLFVLGVQGSTRAVRVAPFATGETANLSDNSFPPNGVLTGAGNPIGWVWSAWPANPVAADFWRVLQNVPETWKLEGRVHLTNIGITDRNNFNLFLYIKSGLVKKYWPAQLASVLESDPAQVTFGQVRCATLAVTSPPLDFGKVPLGSAPTKVLTITNSGAPGSMLHVSSTTPPAAPFTITSALTKTGGGPAPFDLGPGQTANATIQFNPITESTIGMPHSTTMTIQTDAPDPPDVNRIIPMAGHARKPIDLEFILDQSGSMLSQAKWVTTEWATDVVAEVARIFNVGSDRMGAVGFGGPSNNPQWLLLKTLDNTPAPGAGSFSAQFGDADPLWWTPIGLGIVGADAAFNLTPPLKMGILMSDGQHNRPVATSGATTVAGLMLPANVANNTKQMEIHTVALGTDWGVSTALLSAIKEHYKRPGTNPPLYNITEHPEQLWDLFIQAVMDAYIVNQVDLTPAMSGGPGFAVDAGERKILAMVIWDRGTTPADIKVEVYDGTGGTLLTTYDNTSPNYYKGPNSGQPYTYIYVTTPPVENQVWRITNAMGGALPGSAHPIVLVDLRIEAVFTVSQAASGTGNDIILKTTLSELGQPVTNTAAHSVTVLANISRPTEGLGTYLSTHIVAGCQEGPPHLPPTTGRGADAMSTVGVAPAGGAQDTTRDAPLPHFAKVDSLFQACNQSSLGREDIPGLQLYDDGTHGDATPNDGEYTLRFANTQYEGSYIVHFRVRGTSPGGGQFTRRRVVSAYLRVDVDPSTSIVGSQTVSQSPSQNIVAIYTIPKDRFGGYLGPGHKDVVSFATSSGSLVGGIVDHNNGIYAQQLRYDPRTDRPTVTVTVQGDRVDRVRLVKLWELVLPFAGRTLFDNALGLDDGTVVGARLGYRLTNQLTLEAEGSVTFAKDTAGESGHVIQALGNLRWDVAPLRIGNWTPHVTAGAGYVLFRGFGTDDDSFVYQGGVGSTLQIGNTFGVRVDGRVLRIADVFGVTNTTNYQVSGGLVWWF